MEGSGSYWGAPRYSLKRVREEHLREAEKILEGKADDERLSRSEREKFDEHMKEVRYINRRLKGGDTGQTEEGETTMSIEDRQQFDRFIRTGDGGETRAASQSIGAAAEGGALASTGLFAELQVVMQQFGGVRGTRARIFGTAHGRAFNLPGLDDVANSASIVSEGSTIAATTNLTFSDVQFGAHTYQAGPITLTHEQLQDSELDVVEIVTDAIGTRIARATEQDYAGSTATSSTAPNGLITASSGAVTIGAGSSNLALQDLRDLFFSVDPAYRDEAEWAVSDSALQALADLEDADNRPLIEPDVREGLAGRLFGKPVHVVQNLGDIASSSAIPIVFGDYRRGFGIRDVSEVRVQRLDEKFAEQRRVGFLAWFRSDSKPLFSSTIAAANRPLRALKTT